MVSWYSANSSGLTAAWHRSVAQEARQSNGGPRQKLALATTLVSKTTLKLYFFYGRFRWLGRQQLHLVAIV